MIRPEEAKRILRETGVMSKAVAEKTGMCKSYISEWLNNRRILSTEQLTKLNAYFDKLKTIM